RMPIQATRSLLTAALNGSLNSAEFRKDDSFRFEVPTKVDGVPTTLLTPRNTWESKDAYDLQAQKLIKMFSDNFNQYMKHVDEDVHQVAL
ncbi:MAG: phosphoenolpyruvate carboxykinase (ATP), partial [Paracoccaceae bacterium]